MKTSFGCSTAVGWERLKLAPTRELDEAARIVGQRYLVQGIATTGGK